MKKVDVKEQKNVIQEKIIVLNAIQKENYVINVKKIIILMIMEDAHILEDVKFHIKENVLNVKIILY